MARQGTGRTAGRQAGGQAGRQAGRQDGRTAGWQDGRYDECQVGPTWGAGVVTRQEGNYATALGVLVWINSEHRREDR